MDVKTGEDNLWQTYARTVHYRGTAPKNDGKTDKDFRNDSVKEALDDMTLGATYTRTF